jgi:hypothetical protein
MSLDVYSHTIVPDEVDPDALNAILSGGIRLPAPTAVVHG